MDCGSDYGSHEWVWDGPQRVCGRCGVVDLEGRRLVDRVLAGLTEAGYQVVRTSPRD